MKTFLTTALLFLFCLLNAQLKTDTVITLPEVEKVSNAVIVSAQSPITAYKFISSKNLNDVLRENAGLYLKNYGNGQLSSISIRGTGAAQTDVLWNGIKLNSPALGQVDLSLFNMGMSDRLEFGGISNYGNVGGFLNLKSDTRIDSGFSFNAHLSYGSFNTMRVNGKAGYGDGKFSGVTRLSYFNSDNDYSFVNTYEPGYPKEKLTNARVELLNLMQQFSALFNRSNSIQFNLWISDAQRQIPPILSTSGNETQDDYSLRNSLSWHGKFKRISTTFTSAFLHDVIRYKNPRILVDEKSVIEAFRNNFNLNYDSLKMFSIVAQTGYDFERAVVPEYNTTRNRHIGKMEAGLKYKPTNDFLIQLHLREYLYDKQLSPFAPTLTFGYNKFFFNHHNISVRVVGARNFRFPTLNDLYWDTVGNKGLRTEKGFDAEAGILYGYYNGFYFHFKTTGYCKYINNWIQWISNGLYWKPQNVKRVLTRGVELSARLEGPFRFNRNFNLALNVNYTYTKATNLDTLSAFDQSKGKQLIYVPLHIANTLIHVEYKKFYLRASSIFTDAVFIATDNSQHLNGYYLLDLELGKDFELRNYGAGVAFRVNNATNSQYQNVAQRPMPGRNFEGIIRITIN